MIPAQTQTAAQETEITSYLTNSLDSNVGDLGDLLNDFYKKPILFRWVFYFIYLYIYTFIIIYFEIIS
jgi:hypothetical protein